MYDIILMESGFINKREQPRFFHINETFSSTW